MNIKQILLTIIIGGIAGAFGGLLFLLILASVL